MLAFVPCLLSRAMSFREDHQMETQKAPLILDLHIPYCIQQENFLDGYYTVGSNQEKNQYLLALEKEVRSYVGELEEYEIQAVRLSGGSTSVMSPDLLGRLLTLIRQSLPLVQGAEVSYDALPNTIGTPSLSGISAGHPTRVELMMRSENDRELRALNCPFSMDDTRNAMLFFQKFHLNNVGLTVHYGIPGQSMQSWHNTLHACEIMGAKHITVSPLNTADNAKAETLGLPDFPGKEERLEMYRHACKYLAEQGYIRYGVGLFARPGFESRFHLLWMNNTPIIGMGVGGISNFEGYLLRNTNNPGLYIKHAGDIEKLTAQVAKTDTEYQLRRALRLGLGLACGVDLSRLGLPLSPTVENALAALEAKGWLRRTGESLVLTHMGQFHYSEILFEF